MTFTPVDWGIVVGYLRATVAVGLVGQAVRRRREPLSGGGAAARHSTSASRPWPRPRSARSPSCTTASSAIRYGFAAFAAALISGVVMIFVGRTGFVISRLRDLRLMTVPEYFEVQLQPGPAPVHGHPGRGRRHSQYGRVPQDRGRVPHHRQRHRRQVSVAVMTAILVLELMYTVLGGMVSVVITDFVQYVLLSVATIVVSIYAVYSQAGAISSRRSRHDGRGGFRSHPESQVWHGPS